MHLDKKTINALKPTIRAIKKDARRIGLAFDGVKAFVSLATDREGLAVAERELRTAIASMRANLDAVANAIGTTVGEHLDVAGDVNAVIADHTDRVTSVTASGQAQSTTSANLQ